MSLLLAKKNVPEMQKNVLVLWVANMSVYSGSFAL